MIEASRLFGFEGEQIRIVVHPQSVAHGFVVFSDGSVKSQLAAPDMRVPIGYALAFPNRLTSFGDPDSGVLEMLGAKQGEAALRYDFEPPDPARFPCIRLAYEALSAGGTLPAVLSAANEVAVKAFVEGRIAFGRIPDVIEGAMDRAQARRADPRRGTTSRREARKAAGEIVEAIEKACEEVPRFLTLLAVVTLVGFEKVVTFLVMLSVLIVLHELGHSSWRAATACALTSSRSALGRDWWAGRARAAARTIRCARCRSADICAMEGEDNKVSEAQQQREFLAGGAIEESNFQAKSPWRRLAIILAGPLANFILCYVILLVGALAFGVAGDKPAQPVVGEVLAGSPAAVAGIRPGDRIIAIDNVPVTVGQATRRYYSRCARQTARPRLRAQRHSPRSLRNDHALSRASRKELRVHRFLSRFRRTNASDSRPRCDRAAMSSSRSRIRRSAVWCSS